MNTPNELSQVTNGAQRVPCGAMSKQPINALKGLPDQSVDQSELCTTLRLLMNENESPCQIQQATSIKTLQQINTPVESRPRRQ